MVPRHALASVKEGVKRIGSLQEVIESGDLITHGAPTKNKFYYPADKRRTAQHTLQMQKAEHHQDLFWNSIDERVNRMCSVTSIAEILPCLDLLDRTLVRTPDWVAPVQSLSTKKSETTESSGEPPAWSPGTSFIEIRSPKQTLPAPKARPKTRGAPTETFFDPDETFTSLCR